MQVYVKSEIHKLKLLRKYIYALLIQAACNDNWNKKHIKANLQ